MSTHDLNLVCHRNLDRVYGFFAYSLSSRADAEDLTQQTFERATRAWAGYDESRAGAATWLASIARNLLIDHLRAGRTVRTRSVDDADLEAIPAPPDHLSLGLDPDLEDALAGLADRERELIALRFGADLTSGEIAELTGLTTSNVHQILSRSLRRMRTTLDREPVGAET
jgi:RNA polymerase sigma-70 factor (ECF subfamily)